MAGASTVIYWIFIIAAIGALIASRRKPKPKHIIGTLIGAMLETSSHPDRGGAVTTIFFSDREAYPMLGDQRGIFRSHIGKKIEITLGKELRVKVLENIQEGRRMQ